MDGNAEQIPPERPGTSASDITSRRGPVQPEGAGILRQHRRHSIDQPRGGALHREPCGIDHGGGAGVEGFAVEQDGAQRLRSAVPAKDLAPAGQPSRRAPCRVARPGRSVGC